MQRFKSNASITKKQYNQLWYSNKNNNQHSKMLFLMVFVPVWNIVSAS